MKSSSAGDWILMQNKWGAAWELPKAPTPPLDFKMVTDDGEEVGGRRDSTPCPGGQSHSLIWADE